MRIGAHALLCITAQTGDLLSETQEKRREKAAPAPSNDASTSIAFAEAVGRLVRRGRARRGITRRQLATDSGISERYLAQIEGGYGNPSLTVLKAVADALVGLGVGQSLLSVDWKGESQPAVATGDGVKEPLNRRATIDINFAGQSGAASPVASAPVPNP